MKRIALLFMLLLTAKTASAAFVSYTVTLTEGGQVRDNMTLTAPLGKSASVENVTEVPYVSKCQPAKYVIVNGDVADASATTIEREWYGVKLHLSPDTIANGLITSNMTFQWQKIKGYSKLETPCGNLTIPDAIIWEKHEMLRGAEGQEFVFKNVHDHAEIKIKIEKVAP